MDGEARAALGFYLVTKGLLSEGAAELRQAIKLAPMHAQVLRAVSMNLPYLGEVEEAMTLADRALRLDPFLPAGNKTGLLDSYFHGRRFDRVIEIATSIPEKSRGKWAWITLAMSYAYLGQTTKAEAAKVAYITRYGVTSIEQQLNEGLVYLRQQEQDVFVDGYRKLGLPICAPEEYVAKLAKPIRLAECSKS